MSLVSCPQLPPELQGRILQLAAHVSSGEEKNRLMLVSQLAYDRVSYIAYRTIGITNCQSFYQFFSSVERKGVSFFAARLRGLHIWVPGSAAGMFWSTLFTSIIPELFNLNYLQVFGDLGYGPETAVVRQALHVAVRALPNLNYFVVSNSLLKAVRIDHSSPIHSSSPKIIPKLNAFYGANPELWFLTVDCKTNATRAVFPIVNSREQISYNSWDLGKKYIMCDGRASASGRVGGCGSNLKTAAATSFLTTMSHIELDSSDLSDDPQPPQPGYSCLIDVNNEIPLPQSPDLPASDSERATRRSTRRGASSPLPRDRPAKRRKTTRGSTKKSANSTGSSPSPPRKRGRPRKKKHSQSPVQISLDSDDDVAIPEIKINCFIHVREPLTGRALQAGRGKKSTSQEFTERGPFRFTSRTSYDDFLALLAKNLPCPQGNLPIRSIKYRFTTPKSFVPLGLSNDVAFDSLLDFVKGKKTVPALIIEIDKPQRQPDQPFWDTGDPAQPKFELDTEEMSRGTSYMGPSEQRDKIGKHSMNSRRLLEEKYPIGNDPDFPSKRIYCDPGSGMKWELKDICLTAWALRLSQDSPDVTLDKPPYDTPHFSAERRIVRHPAAPPPVANSSTSPLPDTSQNNSLAALTQIMTLRMMQEITQSTSLNASLHSTSSGHNHRTAASPPSSPTCPTHPDIPLFAFCSVYHVSSENQDRLEKMHFEPGDKLDGISEATYQKAGFEYLSWKRMVSILKTYIRDREAGKFVPTFT
ncbi:hypothetical protein DL96DRAFT_1763264, partial [Flagelloscypha sp. PMI_526]